MHILLKKHTDVHKGVLIITHKEYPFLKNKLKHLKQDYYILCHYGWNVAVMHDSNIDNYLIPESRSVDKSLPFTSRNFLPNCFSQEGDLDTLNKILTKYGIKNNILNRIDFLHVGRAVEFKKLIDTLLGFQEFNAKHDNKYTICFVILEQPPTDYYHKFLKTYSETDNSRCLLIDTHCFDNNNDVFKGLSSEELAVIYSNSNIYIHGSEEEGESRTIQEGLLSGCVVMAKDNVKGGGLDYLNFHNSVLYNKTNIVSKMVECVDKQKNYIMDDSVNQLVNEKYTVNKFLKSIYKKYKYEMEFEKFADNCNTDSLCFSLPGHNLKVDWFLDGKPTADILTDKQYDIFTNYI